MKIFAKLLLGTAFLFANARAQTVTPGNLDG